MNRTIPIAAALAALVAASAPALAQSTATTGVHDKARMFSAEAVKKADAALRDAESGGKLQVMIETFESLPDGETPRSTALARAKSTGLKGLEVVIAKKEHKVYAEPSQSAEGTFSKDEVARINAAISTAFKAGDFDKGLLDATAEIRRAVLRFGVRDGARMFTPAALAKADDALDAVHKQTRLGTIVETVDTLGDRSPREAALDRAKALQVHGLYVLIAKKEHKVFAEPSQSARNVFTKEKIAALDQAIAAAFKAGDFDKGLLAAVDAVKHDAESQADAKSVVRGVDTPSREVTRPVPIPPPSPSTTTTTTSTMPPPKPDIPDRTTPRTTNPPAAPAMRSSMIPMLLLLGGGALVFLWLISKLFRSSRPANTQASMGYGPNPNQNPNMNPGPGGYAPTPARGGYAPQGPPQGYGYGGQPAPAPGYGYGPPPQQGGGGFMSGALGGAAGAIAGNILYDHLGRPHQVPQGGMPTHNIPPTQQGGVWGGGGQDQGNNATPAETYDPNAGGGADWGTPDPASGGEPAGTGGDWGTPEPAAETGGDWGGNEPAESADWGTNDPADAGSNEADAGGGDWGGGGDAGTTDDQSASW